MNGDLDLASPAGQTIALLPEVLLSVAALAVLLVVSWRHAGARDSRLAGWLSLGSLALALAGFVGLAMSGVSAEGIPLMVALDGFRYTSGILILLFAMATVLVSLGYLEREGLIAPEYYVLVLLATVGMLFMVASQDLIVLFLGLETMSVAVYVLAGYNRRNPFSAEAALKYFLVGAFASCFLLYGIALVYGATGSTNVVLIGAQFAQGHVQLMAKIGLALLLVGFGFKIAVVPFHMWAPDVYDGAPTPITGFMATAVKAAAFVAFARVLSSSFPSASDGWQPVVWVLASLTMIVGNLVALAQRSIKRLLAYSSVAHAGYLLAALWSGSSLGLAAMLLYLAAYGLTTIATFALLAWLGNNGEREVTLRELAGLASSRPGMAFAMAVCMLSLLGFPGTIGFIGKWYILSSIVAEKQGTLAVVLVLTSLVSAGYYLPVIMSMFMQPPRVPLAHADVKLPRPAAITIALAIAAVLLFGFWPQTLLTAAGDSAASLVQTGSTPAAGQ